MNLIIRNVLVFIIILACLSLAACGSQPDSGRTPLARLGKGEGNLNIIAWEGYVERGENDKRYDWVTTFEKETGCKVKVEIASSSAEMVMLMNQGRYDLATVSGDAAGRLISSGKVQPINTELIPSWRSIDPRLIDAPWHTIDGVHYGTPFLWNISYLMYDTEVFPTPPENWDVVYQEFVLPDGISNAGRILAYEEPIAIADAALNLMRTRPELGITDPYELDRNQFGEAIELLRNQRGLVSGYWSDAASQIDFFAQDGNAISISWPYQIAMLQQQGMPVAGIVPSGKVTGRADTLMLHTNAPHPNCAYLWMEHSLDPKVQGDAAAWTESNPSVPEACDASSLLGENGCELNGYNNFENVFFWKTPVEDCGDGRRDCVPYSDWVSAYLAIIGGQ
jgi:putative spermidine/putrescine transport system substrate-binding protein